MKKSIELLSPAKNLACGIAAVNHGADAVYIGAPKFGARAAAGNSINDIETLANYAHRFGARVYVALNTILFDNELDEAERLIWQVYEAGADALIVQDMGILRMNLPPIALHASTQTDIRTAEKALFIEKSGFSQMVLARELNLAQIRDIAQTTPVALEFFVQGALCVSCSGQCYVSAALGGRSANRGECAQYCRLPYDLLDNKGNILLKNKHLLSLKDLNLSDCLGELIEAGISSFKIEGRLKDVDYVKNNTAFYRKKLDAVLENKPDYRKASSGKVYFFFEPNPEKTFHRGSTDYFLHGRKLEITSFDTPKSLGEKAGFVVQADKKSIVTNSDLTFHNGDGFCFLNKQGEFEGFRANRVEQLNETETRIFTMNYDKTPQQPIDVGTRLYRNYDIEFDRLLQRNNSAERKIAVSLLLRNASAPFSDHSSFSLQVTDEDENCAETLINTPKELARNEAQAWENLRSQLSKWGNSDYEITTIDLQLQQAYFIPSSLLSAARRELAEKLDEVRKQSYKCPAKRNETDFTCPEMELSYSGNVANHLAEKFYREHGVQTIAPAFELNAPENVPLMFCKHCLKYSLGACPQKRVENIRPLHEPLRLRYRETELQLKFDCKRCEMQIF